MTSALQAAPSSDGLAAHLLVGPPQAGAEQPAVGDYGLPAHGGYQYSYVAPPKGRIAKLVDRMPRWVSPLGLTTLLSGGWHTRC